MKAIINESRLSQIMGSFIKKELGEFVPSSGDIHPHYVGGFFSDVEDDAPIAFIINNNNDLINMLYVREDLFKTLVNIFSVEDISDEMSLFETIREVAQDIIGNDLKIRGIDIF
jgi:hypothetical protein